MVVNLILMDEYTAKKKIQKLSLRELDGVIEIK